MGTDDQSSWTYDSDRGNLVASSRAEPLIGAPPFGYDAFNWESQADELVNEERQLVTEIGRLSQAR